MKFHTSGNQNIVHIDEFKVIPTSNTDIILGMSFLQKNDAVIDLKEGFITIDGIHFEMTN